MVLAIIALVPRPQSLDLRHDRRSDNCTSNTQHIVVSYQLLPMNSKFAVHLVLDPEFRVNNYCILAILQKG